MSLSRSFCTIIKGCWYSGFIECLWNDSLPFFFLLKVGWHLEITSVTTILITVNLEQETQRSVSGDLLTLCSTEEQRGWKGWGCTSLGDKHKSLLDTLTAPYIAQLSGSHSPTSILIWAEMCRAHQTLWSVNDFLTAVTKCLIRSFRKERFLLGA